MLEAIDFPEGKPPQLDAYLSAFPGLNLEPFRYNDSQHLIDIPTLHRFLLMQQTYDPSIRDEDIQRLEEALLERNRYAEVVSAKLAMLSGWQNVVAVALGECFESVSQNERVAYELLEALLRFIAQTSTHIQLARSIASLVLRIMATLKETRQHASGDGASLAESGASLVLCLRSSSVATNVASGGLGVSRLPASRRAADDSRAPAAGAVSQRNDARDARRPVRHADLLLAPHATATGGGDLGGWRSCRRRRRPSVRGRRWHHWRRLARERRGVVGLGEREASLAAALPSHALHGAVERTERATGRGIVHRCRQQP